jgi:hypothetical protein
MPELKRSSTKDALVDKVLIPLAAAGASAAGGFLARKAPEFVEQKLLPKLREADPKSALEGTRDVAQTLAGRAQEVVKKAGPRSPVKPDELRRRRQEREQHRAQRRKPKA